MKIILNNLNNNNNKKWLQNKNHMPDGMVVVVIITMLNKIPSLFTNARMLERTLSSSLLAAIAWLADTGGQKNGNSCTKFSNANNNCFQTIRLLYISEMTLTLYAGICSALSNRWCILGFWTNYHIYIFSQSSPYIMDWDSKWYFKIFKTDQ